MSLGFPRELFMDMYLNGREDIKQYVRQTDPVTAKYGMDDEQGEPSSFLTATLDNSDGRWTRGNPMSPYYSRLRPNVECRWGFWLTRDTMSRTVSNGWGTATSGDVWSSQGTASNFAVSPSGATHSVPGTGQFLASFVGTPKLNLYQKIDYTPSFTNVTGAPIEPANLLFRRVDADNMYILRVTVTTAEVYNIDLIRRWFNTSLGSVTELFVNSVAFVVPGLTHTSGQKVSIAAAIEGRTVHAKIWLASAPEPAGWQFSAIDVESDFRSAIVQPGQWGVRSGVDSGNTNALPVVFTYSGYEAKDFRAVGELSDLAPEWDETHRIKVARLRADGILRRLRQNNPPVRSTLRRGIDNASGVVAYWHCEDGSGAPVLSSGVPDGIPMTFSGAPTLASDSAFACSQALPVFRSSRWVGSVRPYTATGSVTFQFLVSIPATGTDNSVLASIYMTGTLWYADIIYNPGSSGTLTVKLYNRSNTLVHDTGVILFAMDGKPSRVQLNLNNNSADISGTIAVYKPITNEFTGYYALSASAVQVGSAETVFMNGSSLNAEVACGHVVVYKEDVNIVTLLEETRAYDSEQAVARFPRLCAENNIPYVLHAETFLAFVSTQYKMGPQRPEQLLKLLTDCVTTAQAVLYESQYTTALGMRSLDSLYAQEPVLGLDYSAEQVAPPLTPAPDDYGLINDVTVERSEGGDARAVQTTGPRNTNSPKDDAEGVGRYESQVDVNTYQAVDMQYVADFELLRGIATETRYPSIALELAASAIDETQAFEALDVCMGDRITVTNLTDADIYLPIDQLVTGREETLVNQEIHKISYNTVPASPYEVLTLDTDDGRLDGDVTLAEDLDATETSIDVTPVDALITTSAGDHPYQVTVDGELMTVTACSGAGPTQTLTVVRGVNMGGVGITHLTGAAVLLYPTVYLGR